MSIKLKGIDVSAWQGTITTEEFKKAMNSGIDFAILRLGYTGSASHKPALDKYFEQNYKNAVAAGLPVGVYFYSLAINSATATEEANFCISHLKNKKITWPVYIDMEDTTRQSSKSKSVLANVANTFCAKLQQAGYKSGVYASLAWLNNKIGTINAGNSIWVAQYYKECQYKKPYDMWQYTSTEKVPGIATHTDVSWCYKDFRKNTPRPEGTYPGEWPVFNKYIEKGDKGKSVKNLQLFLNWALDLKLKINSVCDTNTVAAIKKFQKLVGITVDGKFGKTSLAKAKAFKKDTKKGYTGKMPELHVKRTAQEVANHAAEWAKKMATLNTFHYGEGGSSKMDLGKDVYNITHSTGCYFCGTNKKTKVDKIKALKRSDLIANNWYKTYVCNPFVYSSWVHGGLVTSMNCTKNGNLSIFTNSSTFKNLGHPAYSSLKKGDVLLKYVNGIFKHAAIYVGDGNYSEATSYTGKFGTTASKNSIRTKALTTAHYKDFSVVCRFNKTIDADIIIQPGEYSSRVGDWQDYLNWWSDGAFYKEAGGRDNMFGDNTKKWTIKFQEQELGKGEGDGLVGSKTINKAKSIKK